MRSPSCSSSAPSPPAGIPCLASCTGSETVISLSPTSDCKPMIFQLAGGRSKADRRSSQGAGWVTARTGSGAPPAGQSMAVQREPGNVRAGARKSLSRGGGDMSEVAVEVAVDCEPRRSFDVNRLDVHELADAEGAELAPVARLLDAAEGQPRIGAHQVVDEAAACREAARHGLAAP